MAQSFVAWIVFCLSFGFGLARFRQQPPPLDPPSQSKPPDEASIVRSTEPPAVPPTRAVIVEPPPAMPRKLEVSAEPEAPAQPTKIDTQAAPPAVRTSRKLDGPIEPAAYSASADKVAAPVAPAVLKLPPRPVNASALAPAAAIIKVTVPADATIWIENQRMTQTGVQRSFISPPLEHGKTYAYTMKVSWPYRTGEFGQQQEITIRAGQTTTIDFVGLATEANRRGMVGEAQGNGGAIRPAQFTNGAPK